MSSRNRGSKYVNRIFVAEERCNELQLDGNDQLTACYSDYDKIIQYGNEECKVWPNRNIPVSDIWKSGPFTILASVLSAAKRPRNVQIDSLCCTLIQLRQSEVSYLIYDFPLWVLYRNCLGTIRRILSVAAAVPPTCRHQNISICALTLNSVLDRAVLSF